MDHDKVSFGMNMKKTVTAAAVSFALISGQAYAGGMAEPMMEPEVIAEESSSSGGFILPLILIALLVAASSSSGGGGSAARTDG